MSKGGSSPAGMTTTTTQNPTQASQLPFLTGGAGANTASGNTNVGWNQAYNLATGNPYQYYPGQTLANFNPFLPSGYNQMALAAENANGGLLPQGNSLFSNAANGGMGIYGSPAFGGLSDIASGTNAYLQGSNTYGNAISAAGNSAAANPYSWMLANLGNQVATGGNAGMDELSKTAAGDYLNSNPYLDSMFGSASNAVTRAYQNATAPQTASNFSGAGRYGSGAYAGMVGQNEQNLGTSLGNLSSSIYGGNYQAERARQDAAGQALGALTQQNYGLQGSLLNQAGSQYLGGLNQAANNYASAGNLQQGNLTAMQNALSGLQSGYQAGNNNQMQALALFPSLLNAQYSPSQAMVQAGQGLTGLDQQQIQDQMNRFYGNISAPWQTNQAYLNQIGQPTTGSAQTQQPYYQNQLANILGAGVGGLGLFNGAKSALGGTGSLFGGGSVAPWALDASGASVPLDTAALAGSSAIDFGGGEAASALPAAAMAWIICTELVKQGRLPRRWWAVGAKTFAAYPEIAKRGYYVWAIPSVRHLRRKPNSVYSRVLCKVFNWRAEDIAARAGVKGARKLWRGRAVTAALALPCLALGAVAKTQDWRSIYRNEGLI